MTTCCRQCAINHRDPDNWPPAIIAAIVVLAVILGVVR